MLKFTRFTRLHFFLVVSKRLFGKIRVPESSPQKAVWESYKNGKYSWSGKGWNNKEKVRDPLDANRVGHDLSVLLNRVAGGDRQILKDSGYAQLQAESRDNPASIPATRAPAIIVIDKIININKLKFTLIFDTPSYRSKINHNKRNIIKKALPKCIENLY